MQHAADELCEVQLAIHQEKVERHVAQLAALRENRAGEVDLGNASGLIRDRWVGVAAHRGQAKQPICSFWLCCAGCATGSAPSGS